MLIKQFGFYMYVKTKATTFLKVYTVRVKEFVSTEA